MLDKTYRPAEVEARLYADWLEHGAFVASGNGEPWCLMMPPPNVTGSLHMGHALTFTVQDTLTRFERKRGRRALWQPGMDHAGIATQMVVERKLASEGKDRRAMGREAFLQAVWAWKEESGGAIGRQLRRLGASPDWSRERFTMDAGLSAAVAKVFVELHRQGLIYKDKRLVNWDPKLQTAISDLEVVQTEMDGHLWHFRYPILERPGESITVATTRPETMLGDTGVAVHPDDERYRHLHGLHAVLPLVGRHLRIVADSYSDPEKGTGAVKITPAHDFNDFEVGRRHDLPQISVLDREGRITGDEVPPEYRGLDRFEARKRIVQAMEEQGLLDKVEKHRHAVPHGDRSGVPIEPFLTDQWYCDAATLAKAPIEAVESGKTVFVPRQYENTFFEWMRNIQPWCISRQLWWGHQIPAWYGPDGQVFVAESEADAVAAASAHYGHGVELTRDPDVLDTWFSSALWPFSTLGWPEKTPELDAFYPTDVLVTGFDIIFFWVARMMMMGCWFMGDVPFRTVYIHGLVRDEAGQKMSKTKGNVVDPLDLADEYGADALRFAILASLAQGRDIKFGESRVQGYRNFVTKLWNACRFAEMNGAVLDPAFRPADARQQLNRWILGALASTAAEVTAALEAYRFNDAALGLYRFIWDKFCDWYLELAKPFFQGGDDAEAAAETQRTMGYVISTTLQLLNPLAPYVTEELHARLFGTPEGTLIRDPWPEPAAETIDPKAVQEIEWLIGAISAVRAARADVNVPASAVLDLQVEQASDITRARLERHRPALERLARIGAVHVDAPRPTGGLVQLVVEEATFVLPLGDAVDLDAERKRLAKEIDKARKDAASAQGRLANPGFLAKAEPEVVEETRTRVVELTERAARLEAALAAL
ncbi:MAG TPA: valine--tRNA ligase [Geminicoccus sp.]|jgi:valyl-tRNA synthetase|uniref:valine--tRNA ligase n=1 Tax=Geminicoccus sp. TaxID=2024832 RepID=UPI002E33C06B|nr:valine--tRNA ligase [Geminicoccus sp.]HEX2525105.1 valine--tRNA ligase [Geminicoccus sp.]